MPRATWTWTFDLPPEQLWPVLADPSEMELAVTNLALNAQDAMPRAGVLRIAARKKLSGGS